MPVCSYLSCKLRSAVSPFSALLLNCFAYQSGNQSYSHPFPVMISSREIDEGHHSIISFNQSAFFPSMPLKPFFTVSGEEKMWRFFIMWRFHNLTANLVLSLTSPLLACFKLTENLLSSFTINWLVCTFSSSCVAQGHRGSRIISE